MGSLKPMIELRDGFLAIAKAGVEFTFAQSQDVRAQLEALFVEFGALSRFSILRWRRVSSCAWSQRESGGVY